MPSWPGLSLSITILARRLLLLGLLIYGATLRVYPYDVVIQGIPKAEISKLAAAQVTCPWGKKNLSGDPEADHFRLSKDVSLIRTVLHSFGYFDAEITVAVENRKIIFRVTLNERYKLDGVVFVYAEKDYDSNLSPVRQLEIGHLNSNSYIDTKELADAGERIDNYFESIGYAFVHVEPPILEVDKARKKIIAIYRINLCGKTIIDKTILKIKSSKAPKLLEPFVRNRILWSDGQIYDAKKIEDTKTDLMDTGIFAVVDVTLTDRVQDVKDPGICHTTSIVSIEEAPLRDISVGVKYGTSEKIGAFLSWTHYNVDGKGSRFSTTLDLSKNTKIGRLKYNNFDTFGKNQELASQVFYMKENVPTYNVSKIGCESILWQRFSRGLKIGAGACSEYSTTQDNIIDILAEKGDDKPPVSNHEKIRFRAIGTPIGIQFSTTDNFLDPQSGVCCSGMITPYFSNLQTLTILNGKISSYLPVMKSSFRNTIIIASYVKFGSIIRNTKSLIPRDKLFFAGGANSIRGYGYQKIGEHSADNKPLGGESVFEFGIEPRYRISENFGIAIFVEGGNVYSSKLPKPFSKTMFGYGCGVRYYTPLGPIRLDLAFPVKRRKTADGSKHLDSRLNVYLSIGQAF
jgi:translocation and assembly module TamA